MGWPSGAGRFTEQAAFLTGWKAKCAATTGAGSHPAVQRTELCLSPGAGTKDSDSLRLLQSTRMVVTRIAWFPGKQAAARGGDSGLFFSFNFSSIDEYKLEMQGCAATERAL